MSKPPLLPVVVTALLINYVSSAPLFQANAAEPLEYEIRQEVVREGFDEKTCWVHARAGIVPAEAAGNASGMPSVVMTMQKLLLTGSDIFYAINDVRTDNLGKSWSEPVEHTNTLGRRDEPDGIIVAMCDMTPQWHAKSGVLLGIGHTVRYENNKVMNVRPRETPYTIYDPKTREWTAWKTMPMPDLPHFKNAGAGCVQRVDLPDGDILLPIYHKLMEDTNYSVTVLRCGFDGKDLTLKEYGNSITVPAPRGLCEPSLTKYQDRYYLTLRNDKAGYVSTSDDGLHFSEPMAWTFDDGQDLGNYNTQQHWVTHSDGLFLAYTRRGADNDHVARHRAPLFIAQVDTESDPDKPTIIRATEKILVPEKGARLGNFGVTNISPEETWVTVTEWMQTTGPNPHDFRIPMKYGANNRVWVARIVWEKANGVE